MAEEVVRKKRTITAKKKETKKPAEEEKVEDVAGDMSDASSEEPKVTSEEEVKETKKKEKKKETKTDTPVIEEPEEKEESGEVAKAAEESELSSAEDIDAVEENDVLDEEKEKIRDRVSNTKSEIDLINSGSKVIPASKKMRKILYSESDIIPLGESLQFESEGALRKKKYMEIMSSMKSHNVLTGKIYSTKTIDKRICAVVNYGPFDVILPQDLFLTERDRKNIEEETDEVRREKRIRRLVNTRIGSEVDFIIINVNEEEGIAVGDRLAAMKIRQKAWFFSTDRKGDFVLKVGTKVEARVVSANVNTLTVEFGGFEFKLKQNEIAYTRIPNVQEEFSIGTTVPIMLTTIERSRKGKKTTLKVGASMREALLDTREREFNKYGINDLVRATITGIETYGIFARLGGKDGKQDILCPFPEIPRYSTEESVLPSLNDEVLVKILHKEECDKDGNKVYRIAGVIIHKI